MFRFLLRFIGMFLLAGAFAALLVDTLHSFIRGQFTMTGFDAFAMAVFQKNYTDIKALGEHVLDHQLAEIVNLGLSALPLWLLLGGVGVLFIWAAPKPKRKIGFSSR